MVLNCHPLKQNEGRHHFVLNFEFGIFFLNNINNQMPCCPMSILYMDILHIDSLADNRCCPYRGGFVSWIYGSKCFVMAL